MKLKTPILYIILLYLICSCSAVRDVRRGTKLINRGISKDSTLLIKKKPTIEIRTNTVIDSSGNTHTVDSIFIYPECPELNIDALKTNSQVRQEEKTKRTETKETGKTDRKEIEQTGKTDRNDSDNERKVDKYKLRKSWWWLWLIIGSVLGFIIRPR